MRRVFLIFLILASSLLTGCDAFRFIAGRPTSSDIEAKKVAIAAEKAAKEAAHKAYLDSLDKVAAKAVSDSIAIMDSLDRMKSILLKSSSMGGVTGENSGYPYYIVLGSFMDEGNAKLMLADVTEAGYKAHLLYFKNGYIAVGACPSNGPVKAYENLAKLKGEKFCPKDVWILVNK